MELSFEFWYLFPVSIVIATIAMSSGIGGAVFFSPLFMLVLKIEPQIAVGAALGTEFFGFASGVFAYIRAKLIDYKLALNLLIFSVPAAVAGTLYSGLVPGTVIKAIFASGLLFIGYQLFSSWKKEERRKREFEHKEEFKEQFETEHVDKNGHVYRYTVCNKNTGRLFALIGGAFVGMISVGLAELQEYQLVGRCKVPTPIAIATSVFVVVITVLASSIGHFIEFAAAGPPVLNQVLNILIFTAPGVIVGGQIGPALQRLIPEDTMKAAVSILFILIGVFVFITLF